MATVLNLLMLAAVGFSNKESKQGPCCTERGLLHSSCRQASRSNGRRTKDIPTGGCPEMFTHFFLASSVGMLLR